MAAPLKINISKILFWGRDLKEECCLYAFEKVY
jgi:hypothetical protein